MSKLKDFEDLPYEDEKRYTPRELEEYIKMEKDAQREEFDCNLSRMREEYDKKIAEINQKYFETIKDLNTEKEFYKNIIKSILHIKD